MDKRFYYICQLPKSDQIAIESDIRTALQGIPRIDLESEVENALNSKLTDLEDTIDITKYLTESDIPVYGTNGNGKIKIDTVKTINQAIKMCEEWGWRYDDGINSYSMSY